MEALSWVSVRSTLLSNIQTLWKNLDGYSLEQLQVDLQDPARLLEFYQATDPLVFASGLMVMFTVIHLVMGELTRNYSQVDRAWSILPGVYAWHFCLHDYLNRSTFQPRLVLAAVLISIWGTRLTYNFARKGGYGWHGRDYRFVYIEEKIGTLGISLLNFVFIGPQQDVLLLLMVTPLYLSTVVDTALNRVDLVASVLFLTLLLLETVADHQQFIFQTCKYALLDYVPKDKLKGDYKVGFLHSSGLWQYSRHPNFFAEISMWWMVYLFSVAAHVQDNVDWADPYLYLNWTVTGAVLLTMLFQGSTWLTEVGASGRGRAINTDLRLSISLPKSIQSTRSTSNR
ncbi:hypothetical protein BJV82DRAFT_601331 [Fennellomyces sp. T-0311]|nr:hypothetical protein BJV82DRAFT_601331 [Fennellomyces sp. T-0311]